jgi:hypothetical protein
VEVKGLLGTTQEACIKRAQENPNCLLNAFLGEEDRVEGSSNVHYVSIERQLFPIMSCFFAGLRLLAITPAVCYPALGRRSRG